MPMPTAWFLISINAFKCCSLQPSLPKCWVWQFLMWLKWWMDPLTLYPWMSSITTLGIGWLIVWCLNTLSTFHLYHGIQCTYSCFPGVLSTSTTHNIISKPLSSFPHNLHQNNEQQQEEWILLQYWSLVLAKNIGRARDRTSDLVFWSPVRCWAAHAWLKDFENIVGKGENAGN